MCHLHTLATSRAQYTTLQIALHRRAVCAPLSCSITTPTLREETVPHCSTGRWPLARRISHLQLHIVARSQLRARPCSGRGESTSECTSTVSRPPSFGPPHAHFSPPASTRIFFGDLQQVMEEGRQRLLTDQCQHGRWAQGNPQQKPEGMSLP